MKVTFVRRDRASRLAMVVAPLLALAATCVTSLILFAILGKPSGTALHALLIKPFTNWYSFSEVLLKTAPPAVDRAGVSHRLSRQCVQHRC